MKRRPSINVVSAITLGLIIAAFFGLGIAQYINLVRIDERVRDFDVLAHQRVKAFGAVEQALGFDGLSYHLQDYALFGDRSSLAAAREAADKFTIAVDGFAGIIGLSEDDNRDLSALESAVGPLLSIVVGPAAREEVIHALEQADGEAAMDALDSLRGRTEANAGASLEAIFDAIFRAFLTFVIAAGATLVVIILLFLAFFRMQRGRAGMMVDLSTRLAEGDLCAGVDFAARDDFGRMAENFNNAVTSMRDGVNSAKSAVASTEETGTRLSANIEATLASTSDIAQASVSMKDEIESLNNEVSQASSAVEEIAANIRSIVDRLGHHSTAVADTSSAVEEITASIDSVAKIASDRSESVTKLSGVISTGADLSQSTQQIMEEIAGRIDGMLELIQVINGITEQTSLLSMNAAIEAAHAGEYGRGFAVVASEIQKLSESTAENAATISSTLNDLVEQIGRAQKASEDGGQTFERILVEMNEVKSAFGEINSSTRELATGGREMLKSTEALREISDQIKAGSEEMSAGAEDIGRALVGLNEISRQNRDRIEEVATGVSDIDKSVAEMAKMIRENSKSVAALVAAMDQFNTDGSADTSSQP